MHDQNSFQKSKPFFNLIPIFSVHIGLFLCMHEFFSITIYVLFFVIILHFCDSSPALRQFTCKKIEKDREEGKEIARASDDNECTVYN